MLDFEAIKIPNAKITIIWLHGLGASGHDFMPLVPQFHSAGLAANFILPHAPVQSVTINGGMKMRAWYDIYAFGSDAKEDIDGLKKSVANVHELIAAEDDPSKVVLAGFSQGGATAIAAALTYDKPLAGLIALSTYAAGAKSWVAHNVAQPASLPIFTAHGEWDEVLPPVLGKISKKFLDSMGFNPKHHIYPMGHELCGEEVADILGFLLRISNPSS
jgi:phospholipase/carboxylesterase